MKKLLSTLSSILILTSLISFSAYASETENPDLYALASSLGADTDYINIVNYSYNDIDNPNVDFFYSEFLKNCSNCDAYTDSEYLFKMSLKAGVCMGISSLEILVHNGIISPSDIQPDAEKLCDVERNPKTEYYISQYQGNQICFEMDYYLHNIVANHDDAERCNRLIETAERNMAAKKYFMIMYYSSRGGHALAGIGITDGHWEYDGMEFDKCILTLDSNNRNFDLTAKPFSEDSCIYINSKKNIVYIPKTKILSEPANSNSAAFASVDDETLINYKGANITSDIINTDFSDAAMLYLSHEPHKKYEISITDENGAINDMPEVYATFQLADYMVYPVKGVNFHIEPKNRTFLGEGYNDKFNIKTQRYFFAGETEKGHGIFDVSEKEQSVTAKDGKNIRYIISTKYNEGYYSVSPHFNWEFDGVTDKNLKTRMTEKGMLLSSDGIIETQISTTDAVYDENGSLKDVKANQNKEKITAYNDILLSFDEEDNLRFYIDPDQDGVFDTPVQKGDVNSDGVIDAVDASLILTSYANQSVENENSASYLNETIADYDGNGVIDAVDASAVLTEYAMSSVS